LGPDGERVKRGTIHAFCAALLREFGDKVGLETGFGIADEPYQLSVLARLEGSRPWHGKVLTRFSEHRFRGVSLQPDDRSLFERYEQFLARRKLVDFDTLVLKAAELLESTPQAAEVRARWDVILVDEFQDLNSAQYRVVHELARDHRHVFAVGDHEQSIFSWAGADPAMFTCFLNNFELSRKLYLQENHRCPREVFSLARTLVTINTPIFADRVSADVHRNSGFPVQVRGFENEDAEVEWIIEDIRHDRAERSHGWGDIALLYRRHSIGEALEAAFLNAGIPCRLAHGRALAEDPVVAYVVAALRVITCPADDVYRDQFFSIVLPRAVFDEARAQADVARHDLRRQLNYMAAQRPRGDETRRQIRGALYAWRNLEATGRRHTTLSSLVQELVAQRKRRMRSVLDERNDELSDPAMDSDIVELADRLRSARTRDAEVWIPQLGGTEIALKAILTALDIRHVEIGEPRSADAFRLDPDDVPSVGLPLGLFKAAQLLEIGEFTAAFRDFTAVDIETTDSDTRTAEIVEIAAVRVRGGEIGETFFSRVKPNTKIVPAATGVHGLTDADVAGEPPFEEVWPKFREFCGNDVVVAHNGYEFDFFILRRMVSSCGKRFDLCLYDTLPLARDLYPTSRKLVDLAHQFGIDPGRSHGALDDAQTLARIFVQLDEAKLARARKTALVNLLDHLGVALALQDDGSLCDEARLFRQLARPFALGRYSSCLETYERDRAGDESITSVNDLIERLGGVRLMERIRTEKTADERYPAAMLRLRKLIEQIPDAPLNVQITDFLDRVVLSKWDGAEPERSRVNLLTLHSTKGLEFSRVYIVGAEDAELPGGSPVRGPTNDETEEARRLLYVGMTRTIDRLVLTRVERRAGKLTGGHKFLTEMGLEPFKSPSELPTDTTVDPAVVTVP
jgi:DNA polymerase III epsilon subunit family exonuclease